MLGSRYMAKCGYVDYTRLLIIVWVVMHTALQVAMLAVYIVSHTMTEQYGQRALRGQNPTVILEYITITQLM